MLEVRSRSHTFQPASHLLPLVLDLLWLGVGLLLAPYGHQAGEGLRCQSRELFTQKTHKSESRSCSQSGFLPPPPASRGVNRSLSGHKYPLKLPRDSPLKCPCRVTELCREKDRGLLLHAACSRNTRRLTHRLQQAVVAEIWEQESEVAALTKQLLIPE